MQCCVHNIFLFINTCNPHFILLHVSIEFFIYNYIFFHDIKHTLTTLTNSSFHDRKKII
jgi:hypothetical protein